MDAAPISRLRKAFKYPDEDEDGTGSSRDELDEEQQENLLAEMKAREAQANAQYILIFTILPLTITIPFLYHSLTSPSPSIILPCLLAITSLVATAYTMRYMPIDLHVPPSTRCGQGDPEPGAVQIYLPYLNVWINVYLAFGAWHLRSRRDHAPEGLWLFLLLPGLVLGMVTLVRRSMGDVERGLWGLERLKYDLKGA